MNAINFIKHYGLNTAIRITEDSKNDDFWDTETAFYTDKNSESCVCISELKRLVESVDLINSVGGLTIANKITFQKRLRNEKATHFIQHPENQKLIQLFGRNQRKPEAAIKFDLFEQAIADYKSIYGGEHV